jgi:hypothetical protein
MKKNAEIIEAINLAFESPRVPLHPVTKDS